MRHVHKLTALLLVLLLFCGCAAGSSYGKPQPKEGQDQYLTDPVPEGKPEPVEPQNVAIGETVYHIAHSLFPAPPFWTT